MKAAILGTLAGMALMAVVFNGGNAAMVNMAPAGADEEISTTTTTATDGLAVFNATTTSTTMPLPDLAVENVTEVPTAGCR